MLNYNTLLSAYDDKLTLMQWLKKVEAALKDASAVSFNVNKRGNATITFSVVFEDGSELESNPFILQQGESVTGATITNGHLILTLSNGDTLDAGNTGAVSSFSIDANQHLIVTYQDGSTNDLGAIFTGNVSISGNLSVSGSFNAPVINGETLPSVKPIYFHPITAEGTDFAIQCLILNNDPTQFDGNTFLAHIKDLMDNGAAIIANGAVNVSGTIGYVYAISKLAENNYIVVFNTNNAIQSSANLDTLWATLYFFKDGVNKIN